MKPINRSNNRQRETTERTAAIRKSFYKFLCITLLCCCSFGIAEAQKQKDQQEKEDSAHSAHSEHAGHGHEESKVARKDRPAAKLVIPDLDVRTQDGKQVKFYSDLIKGKKVMINFIYTSCGLTCPMAGRNFEKLQKTIGEDVFLISVSTDPAVDTPQILRKWGEKYHRQKNWTLLTGEESKMKQLLTALTGTGLQRGLHTSLLILFNDASGAWETTSSLMEPAFLLNELGKLEKPVAN